MRNKPNFAVKPLIALLGLLALSLFTSDVSAQTNRAAAKSKAPPPEGNRFLFIVDTSASMKAGAKLTLQAVADIIRSSASGQLHQGDTLGVWTFNKELYAGLMPLQTWTPEDLDEIGLRTLEFLKQQRYEKDSHLDAALAGMYAVIKSSDIITIFLISNGQGHMQGTPFDDEINALYAESLKEMNKDRKPIVTVLQAKSGKVVKYTVNALPWPVVIPEVPIPIKTAVATTVPPVTPEKATPTTSAPTPKPSPPLIVQKPAPPVAPATTLPPPAIIPAPVVVAQPQPAVPIVAPALPALPVPAPAPPVEIAKVEPIVTKLPEPVPPPRPIPTAISNKVVAAPTQIPPNDGEPPSVQTTAQPQPATSNMVTTTGAKPNAPPQSTNTATMQAAALPPEGGGRSKSLLIAAIAMAVIGVGLIALLIYRSRSSSNPSLITHTMGNPRRK